MVLRDGLIYLFIGYIDGMIENEPFWLVFPMEEEVLHYILYLL